MGLSTFILRAQTNDSIPNSPTTLKANDLELDTKVDLGLEPKVYDPNKALLWSIIPGGGQVYNRRWWKVPIVFSTFSGFIAFYDFNNSNYQRFSTAYKLALAGEPHEFEQSGIGTSSLKSLRDQYNRSRQLNAFYLIGVYLLQGVEAYVDAQLRDFDINDDLSSVQITPVFIPSLAPSPNLSVALQLKYNF